MVVGIKQVARRTGASIAASSRVPHYQPHVSDAARRQVLDVVAPLGSRSGRLTRRLREQDAGILGPVIPHRQDFLVTVPARAVERAAYKNQLAVFRRNSDKDRLKSAFALTAHLIDDAHHTRKEALTA